MIELSLIPLSPIPSTMASLKPKKLIIDLIIFGNYIQSYSITLVKRCKDLLSHIGRIFPYKNVFLSVSLTQQLTNHEL